MARLTLPLLGGTLALAVALSGVDTLRAQTSTVTVGPNGVSGGTTVTTGPNGKPCRVVQADGKGDGTVSSSVTAGPGGCAVRARAAPR